MQNDFMKSLCEINSTTTSRASPGYGLSMVGCSLWTGIAANSSDCIRLYAQIVSTNRIHKMYPQNVSINCIHKLDPHFKLVSDTLFRLCVAAVEKYSVFKTIRARFSPRLAGQSPENIVQRSLFVRKREWRQTGLVVLRGLHLSSESRFFHSYLS